VVGADESRLSRLDRLGRQRSSDLKRQGLYTDSWSSSKSFCVNKVQKPGGKCVLISHPSISRALWCLRGPGYIHCGYKRDGYN